MNKIEGFCDLNVPFVCGPTSTLKEVVIRAIQLGYNTIAINTAIGEDVLDIGKKKGKKGDNNKEAKVQNTIPIPPELNFKLDEIANHKVHGKKVTILRRLTVKLTDQNMTQKLMHSDVVKKYDLLAIIPATTSIFQHAVNNLECDIISLEPETCTELRLNRKLYRQAVDKGMFYEVLYSPLLRDSTLRRNIIQTAHSYHAYGKSRNIIISSGALTPMELRDPYDVANLGLLLGLSEGQSRSALSSGCRSVFLHGASRKTGKCVTHVIETDQMQEGEKWKVEELLAAESRLLQEPASKKIKMDTNEKNISLVLKYTFQYRKAV